jgi:hypothetical protein
MKTPTKTSRDNIFELISQGNAFLDFLPPSRARSMVATKLDEAALWLTQVTLDEPDQVPEDDPFGINAGREAMEQAKKEGSL